MAAQPNPVSAPARLLRDDLELAPFTAGVDRGWWRVHSLTFPFIVIEIATAPRPGAPDWLALRFNVSAYPQAPSAQPWDVASDGPLPAPRWPGGTTRIHQIFNPGWRVDALYFPMDRLALEGHDAWLTSYPCHVWDPGKDLSQYLRFVHDLLNDKGYTGVRG